jgi:hypothetical protein
MSHMGIDFHMRHNPRSLYTTLSEQFYILIVKLKGNMDITDRLGILCLATDQQILLLISSIKEKE